MWAISNTPEPDPTWLDFLPLDVLDEYDLPMLFLCRSRRGGLYLAFFAGQGAERIRFVVVPTDPGVLYRLETGGSDLRSAIGRTPMWVFDLDKRWEPVACWAVRPDDLPPGLLPRPGVMLRADMRPVAGGVTRVAVSSGSRVVATLAPVAPMQAVC